MQKENTEARTENNAGGTRVNGTGVWILYCLISAVAELILIGCKIAGSVTWSWPAVLLSYFWISIAVMVAFVLLAVGAHIFCRATRRHREWKRRRKIARTLWESMEGLTLNNVGPIYGVRRQPGEKNRDYKRRILRAARTLDTVNVQNAPTPATGRKLDDIAHKYELRRFKGEADEHLQERIRQAALSKLKGGGDHGV